MRERWLLWSCNGIYRAGTSCAPTGREADRLEDDVVLAWHLNGEKLAFGVVVGFLVMMLLDNLFG